MGRIQCNETPNQQAGSTTLAGTNKPEQIMQSLNHLKSALSDLKDLRSSITGEGREALKDPEEPTPSIGYLLSSLPAWIHQASESIEQLTKEIHSALYE